MTDSELIIEIAKLDGFENCIYWDGNTGTELSEPAGIYGIKRNTRYHVPYYLDSRDAIIPVIEKVCKHNLLFIRRLLEIVHPNLDGVIVGLHAGYAYDLITATPRQLSIALLKATGKYIEKGEGLS